jgi:hypothetical protein
MPVLKADGPSVAVIYFDALKVAALRRDQIDHLAYHVTRLLAGERTASTEWNYLGLTIEVEPDSDGGSEDYASSASTDASHCESTSTT